MIKSYLKKSSNTFFICYAVFAAFGAYFCMYAFRKPFSVGTFETVSFLGNILTFKSALIISQVLGYALSKFIGIKVISELKYRYRAILLIGLILLAELSLLLFAFIPAPLEYYCTFFQRTSFRHDLGNCFFLPGRAPFFGNFRCRPGFQFHCFVWRRQICWKMVDAGFWYQ